MLFMNMYNFKNVCIIAVGLASAILISMEYIYGYNAEADNLTVSRQEQNIRFNRTQYYMLPDDSIIDEMDDITLYLTFARYINQTQNTCCNISRAGSAYTLGKNICLDNLKNIQNGCLVYSFGSKFKFDFETAIYKAYQCEIHTFDPSLSVEGKIIPEGVNFHLMGLSNNDELISAPKNLHFKSEKIWKMRTLSTIHEYLNNSKRIIDILKIDIEGWEWNALSQILQSGVLKRVKQICLEVHFGFRFNHKKTEGYRFYTDTWGNVTIHNQLKTLKELHDYGFRIFISEPIKDWALWPVKEPMKYIHTLVEISLVNLFVN